MSTIIRLTFIEIRKKKILYLTLALTVAFLILYGTALNYAYDSLEIQEAFMRTTISSQLITMGIYAMIFIISFLSIFSSVGAISSEIENGTYDAILAKPIKRYEIVFGKFIGVLLVLIPYITFFYSSIIGLNIFFGKGMIVNLAFKSILKSLLTLYLLPILLTSIGIFFSSFMSTMASGVILVIMYFCAMIGGFLEQISIAITIESTKQALNNIGIITSLIMPSDVIYRKTSSLLFTTSSGLNLSISSFISSNTQPSSAMMIYIIVYILSMIILAVRKFQRRDL
ncbi:MAG: ABC transporter permease [Tepidibacter sp.]|jgi:ABC-type transport system involved in multi-copper enzyme maturation permease subunit|uniref:ABC transporter permease n=1 Tax=Tepidibacter sp. TaxID=2529387 RepID=UPI0025EB8075|nr:ABC transporter permease [Tepidibacter sp.]MCT4508125.1 ABC transporter permease [Tepidibacter sp.]